MAWQTNPGFWVLVLFILYVLGAHIAAWVRRSGQSIPALLWWIVRLGCLVGIPYGALLAGIASPRLMGLTAVDWTRSLGLGVPFALLAWLLITAGWHWGEMSEGRATVGMQEPSATRWLSALLEATGQQLHWAFYRDATIRWLGPYWGAWGGALLALIECAARPQAWHTDQGNAMLLNILLAVVTTALYLTVSNWWLGWGLHMLVLLTTRAPHT
ncbi:MAG: hypothetical protein J7M34_11090 [Anaerolineae bacterium]|nr:hypothetical protein [Anaerolineae bacterium]